MNGVNRTRPFGHGPARGLHGLASQSHSRSLVLREVRLVAHHSLLADWAPASPRSDRVPCPADRIRYQTLWTAGPGMPPTPTPHALLTLTFTSPAVVCICQYWTLGVPKTGMGKHPPLLHRSQGPSANQPLSHGPRWPPPLPVVRTNPGASALPFSVS